MWMARSAAVRFPFGQLPLSTPFYCEISEVDGMVEGVVEASS